MVNSNDSDTGLQWKRASVTERNTKCTVWREKRTPGKSMLQPSLVLKERRRQGEALQWDEGKGDFGTSFQPGKRKGLRSFPLLERSDQSCYQCDSRGPGFFSNRQPSLTGLSRRCWLYSHEGYMSKGLVESSFMASNSCWSQACGTGVSAWMPWEAITWSNGVKSGLHWRPKNVGDARATGYLPRGDAHRVEH